MKLSEELKSVTAAAKQLAGLTYNDSFIRCGHVLEAILSAEYQNPIHSALSEMSIVLEILISNIQSILTECAKINKNNVHLKNDKSLATAIQNSLSYSMEFIKMFPDLEADKREYGISPVDLFLAIINQECEMSAHFNKLVQNYGFDIDEFTEIAYQYEADDYLKPNSMGVSLDGVEIGEITIIDNLYEEDEEDQPTHRENDLQTLKNNTPDQNTIHPPKKKNDGYQKSISDALITIDPQQLKEHINGVIKQSPKKDFLSNNGTKIFKSLKFLPKYGINLLDRVLQSFTPCLGRENEMDKLYTILSKKNKNNAILIGDAGVGKTKIVEGIAWEVLHGKCPDDFLGTVLVELNLNALTAGTKFRGDFEKRVQDVIEEAIANPEVILFIDEIHTFVGAGASDSGLDLSNILKPYIARGDFRLIGATTIEEYKIIEKDKALKRRFSPILVNEPNKQVTLMIMKDWVEKNNLNEIYTIDPAIYESIYALTQKYMPTLYMPDKAIDFLDEMFAKQVINRKNSSELKIVQEKLARIQRMRESIVETGEYDAASTVKQSYNEVMQEIETIKQKSLNKILPISLDTVTTHLEQKIGMKVSANTGLTFDTNELKNKLNDAILGQTAAVNSVVNRLKMAKYRNNTSGSPLASLLMVGSSGVGKTEMGKTIAKTLFNNSKSYLQIDCSEYSQSHDVSKLIGASAGYVGYERGGILTDFVRSRPFSLILFDEIEKAHESLFNLLLQVLNDGRLTDNTGNTTYFNNTIIVFTSNLGATAPNYVSFMQQESKSDYNTALRKHFKPEFLSRISDIIEFEKFGADIWRQLIVKEIQSIESTFTGIKISYTEEVLDELVKTTYEMQNVRNLKNKLEKELSYKIVDFIDENSATNVHFLLKNGVITVQ